MFCILLLATFTFITKSEDFTGACKEICQKNRCEHQWSLSNGVHPCSTYSRPLGIDFSVDPWMEAEGDNSACQETICDTCGTQTQCIAKCNAFKTANGLGSGDYPTSCSAACNQVVNEAGVDWKCFLPATPGYNVPTDFSKPACFPYFECTGQYIAANGKQPCSARKNLVNPWGCDSSSSVFDAANVGVYHQCALLNGDNKCGAQDECVAACEVWNVKARQTQVNCVQECADVAGYKCFVGCRVLDESSVTIVDLDNLLNKNTLIVALLVMNIIFFACVCYGQWQQKKSNLRYKSVAVYSSEDEQKPMNNNV